MKKLVSVLLVAMLMACTLVGCGEAKDDNVLTVGTNAEFPPFEYVGDDGQPDGFDIALIKAIGDKMGCEVVVENMEFASLVGAIGTKIDVAIAGMTIDEERLQSVDFSDPYYDAIQYVIVPEGSDIKTAADLENKRIGVQLGTTGDYAVEEIANLLLENHNQRDSTHTDKPIKDRTREFEMEDITNQHPCKNKCQYSPKEVACPRTTQDTVDGKKDECNQQYVNNIFNPEQHVNYVL